MTRQQRIDEFLEELFVEHKKHGLSPNADSVYNFMKYYDLNEGEENISYNEYFNGWIYYFGNMFQNANNPVYHTNLQVHFLQFNNYPDSFDPDGKDIIKLYLHIKPEAMFDAVKIIHSFIFKEGMLEGSKVADSARSDAIVLRIYGIENANKVINFINKNEFLKHNARLTNPFLMTSGIVGVSYDDALSYNQCVSIVVYQYLDYCIKANEKPNSNGLFEFADFYIREYFLKDDGVKKFTESELFKNNFDRVCGSRMAVDQLIRNFYACFSIFKIQCKSNDIELVYQVVNDYFQNRSEGTIQYFKELYDKYNALIEKEKEDVDKTYVISDKDKSEFFHAMKDYIEYAFDQKEKYLKMYPSYVGRKEYITYLLKSFIEKNNPDFITRDKGFRERLSKVNLNVLTEFGLTPEELVNGVIKDYEYAKNNPASSNKYMDQTSRHPIVEDLNLSYILHGDRDYVDYRRLQAIRNVYKQVFGGKIQVQEKCPYSIKNIGFRTLYKLSEDQKRLIDYDDTSEAYIDEYQNVLKFIIDKRNVKKYNSTHLIHRLIEQEYEKLVKKELMVIRPQDVLESYVRYLTYYGYSTDDIVTSLIHISEGNYVGVPDYIGFQDAIKRIRPDRLDKIIPRTTSNIYQDYEDYVVNICLSLKGDPR